MPQEEIGQLPQGEILSFEEIERLVRFFATKGINRVRITGGEPLVRKRICNLVGRISKIEGISDLSVTTNGILLSKFSQQLKASGLNRVNVSLDSLNPQTFKRITGKEYLSQVWEGIWMAERMGLKPVKINVVVLPGINDNEVIDFARLAVEYDFWVRFIERYPECTLSNLVVRDAVQRKFGFIEPVESPHMAGPAMYFKIKGAAGRIGFISWRSSPFCDSCNRIRVTPDGRLMICLFSDYAVDLRRALRDTSGESKDVSLDKLYQEALSFKSPYRRGAINSKICVSKVGG